MYFEIQPLLILCRIYHCCLTDFIDSHIRSQRFSLTRALTRPTKTPGLISNNHFVISPRNEAGQSVNETITIKHPPKLHHSLQSEQFQIEDRHLGLSSDKKSRFLHHQVCHPTKKRYSWTLHQYRFYNIFRPHSFSTKWHGHQ